MNILLISIDSDIGKAIKNTHYSDNHTNDIVISTSRNNKGDCYVELTNPYSYENLNKFSNIKFDRVYFNLGIGDQRNSRAEVMHINAFASVDLLKYITRFCNKDCKIVVFSSEWGSITNCDSSICRVYRMSKAALNMGVATLHKEFPQFKWILMQPGFVDTKMTNGLPQFKKITTTESAYGIKLQVDLFHDDFGFIDYTGKRIEF